MGAINHHVVLFTNICTKWGHGRCAHSVRMLIRSDLQWSATDDQQKQDAWRTAAFWQTTLTEYSIQYATSEGQ